MSENSVGRFKNNDEYKQFLSQKADEIFKEKNKISKREFLSLFADQYSKLNTTGKKRFEQISNLDGDNTTISRKEMMAFYSLMDLQLSDKAPDGLIDAEKSLLNSADDKYFEHAKDSVLTANTTQQKNNIPPLTPINTDGKQIILPSANNQNFNPDDYSLEKLKEKFPEPQYTVESRQLMPGFPPIINISENDKLIATVSLFKDIVGTSQHFYDEHGNKTKVIYRKNGNIIETKETKYTYDPKGNVTFRQEFLNGQNQGAIYSEYDKHNNETLEIRIDKSGKQIKRIETTYDEGELEYVFLDENGDELYLYEANLYDTQEEVDSAKANGEEAYLKSDAIRVERVCLATSEKVYDENGNLYDEYKDTDWDFETGEEIPGIEHHSPIADDLFKAITAKNDLGLPTTDFTLLKNNINKLTPRNISTIIYYYNNISNSNLLTDLKNEWGQKLTNNKEMNKLIDKVKTTMLESQQGKLMAEVLAEEFGGIPDKKILDKAILEENILNDFYTFLPELQQKTGKSLIQNIMDKNLTLSLEDRKKYISKIIDTLLDWQGYNDEIDYVGIKQHGEKIHAELNHQLEKFGTMDAKKIDNLLAGIPHNIAFEDPNLPNGKVDMDFEQAYNGDCWFISALLAVKYAIGGEKVFSEILHLNEDGNEDIEFPDATETYTITQKDISIGGLMNSADGDGDVKALEFAAKKFLIAQGHVGDDPLNDGNYVATGLSILVGRDNVKTYASTGMDLHLFNTEFSKPNNAIVLARHSTLHDINHAFDADGNNVELLDGHSYTASRIDDEFVYFIDPNKTNRELHLPKADYFKAFDECAIATLKN